MKLLKKFESFSSKYSWLLKLGIVLSWIFWAGQMFWPTVNHLKTSVPQESAKTADWTWEKEKQAGIELNNFLNSKLLVARARGVSYSPYDYFQDLHEIDGKEKQFSIMPRMHNRNLRINEMHQIVLDNMKKGHFAWEDIEKARDSYPEYRVEKPKKGEFSKIFVKFLFGSFRDWILVFYLRSILLAFLLYLTRMCQGKGIFETILADKKKFILSVIAWSAYLFKYPSNVIREIVVEAELRRMGKAFRKLALAEKILVREIANSKEYKSWLANFHDRNQERFQRSFLVALMFTVLFYFLVPVVKTDTVEAKVRDGPTYSSTLSDDSSKNEVREAKKIDDYPVMPESVFTAIVISDCNLYRLVFGKVLPRIVPKKTDRVPRCGYLVEGNLVLTR